MNCIVLPNYNGVERGVLPRLLCTLATSLDYAESRGFIFSVILVDDRSQDSSVRLFRDMMKERDRTHVLSTQNVDVTAALNHGIRYAFRMYPNSRFLITLDSDTALSEKFLFEIVREARDSKWQFGMFASNQYNLSHFPEGTMHRSTGHYVSKAGATLDRDFADKKKTYGKRILCPYLSGALFRNEMLRKIGLIPEQYVHYNNCPELGFRAQMAGWKVKFVKSAVMWHNYRPQSQISSRQRRYRELSRIWNILRFFPDSKVDAALDAYRRERVRSSPTLSQKKSFIRRAKKSVGELSQFSNNVRKRVYRLFVYQ